MRKDPFGLTEMLAPSIEAMGFILWGLEFHANSINAILRIYIDKEGGVTVEDCANVSHQVEGILDVNDPITTHYTLEVSSPGLDRTFFSIEQMKEYINSLMNIQLNTVLEGRRRFSAKLISIENDTITFMLPKQIGKKGKSAKLVSDIEGENFIVPAHYLDRVTLSPTFTKN